MEPAVIISTVAVMLTLVFGMAAHYRTKTYADLLERVARLEARVETYFDAQEKYNSLILHRDDDVHTVDALLEKRQQLEPLEPDEAELLARKLEEIVSDKNEVAGKRAAAAQMLSVRKAREAQDGQCS